MPKVGPIIKKMTQTLKKLSPGYSCKKGNIPFKREVSCKTHIC